MLQNESRRAVGFGLLTASVSSIVALYPALSRMQLHTQSRDRDVIFRALAKDHLVNDGS